MTGERAGREHRRLPPGRTVERLRPLLRGYGITRIANITGLDVLGIPVVAVCRPNARSNAVCQGKGLDIDTARAAGIMEAVETYCAECIARPFDYASLSELRARADVVEVNALPRCRDSLFDADRRLLWIEGVELNSGRALRLPYELVHADFTLPQPPGAGCFLPSTNGLGAGNDRLEAVSHGLREVVERDASALFDAVPAAIDARRLDLDSIDDSGCCAVIARLRAAGLAVGVWDITSDIGLATFSCHIMERADGPGLLTLPAEGSGCHSDRATALLRSLLEAVQTRLTVIVGTRDDIGPGFYNRADDPERLARWRQRLLSTAWARRFADVPTFATESAAAEVALMLSHLKASGLGQAVAVELTEDPSLPFSVVRVVVPGLEGPLSANYMPGARARAAAT